MEYSGQIIKGVGSFYTVRTGQGDFVCKARGRFRKEGITPVPGDLVTFDLGEDGKGYLKEIKPRKNLLVRPAVANIDKLMIVVSACLPKPDCMLVDKLLIQCEMLNIRPISIINKYDIRDEEVFASTLAQYENTGYRLLKLSAHTGEGLEELKREIEGNICCFAGQSAVGKSSLMNAIAPELSLAVGELSEKSERGKHTTRHAELWQVCGGSMLDTPGFSLLDMAELEPWELSGYYPEMREHTGSCRFPECLHISEPDCSVKPLIDQGKISRERYERYMELIEMLKEKRRHKYD